VFLLLGGMEIGAWGGEGWGGVIIRVTVMTHCGCVWALRSRERTVCVCVRAEPLGVLVCGGL
jgi:hypothetical protein